jgi:nitroreductase
MRVSEAVEARRSVKAFDPNHAMSKAEIDRLMTLAMLSPTAFNIQNWRFLLATDPELRKRIRAASWDQAQVTDASLLVILTADLKAWEKDPNRYWRLADEGRRTYVVNAMDGYYRGREQVQRDEAMRSCGMAAQTLMLAAKDLGYDTCPMDGFDFDAVGKLIDLPADHAIVMFVVVGKAVNPAYPRGGQLSKDEVVIYNSFATR